MSAVRFLLLLLCLSLSSSSCLSAVSDALLSFKKSLTVPPSALAAWAPGSDPCKDRWQGVFCNKANTHIKRIHLQNMGLSGKIDVDSLSQIPGLISLSLENNKFSGAVPLFNRLRALRALYLQGNGFSGEISGDYFSGLPRLRKIWLSNNQFTGKIPESLGKLGSLTQLHLEKNKFSGQIPEISQKSLKQLDMSNNKLEGEIPESMSRFGAAAFKGNPGVCGKLMGSDCKSHAALPAEAANSGDEEATLSKLNANGDGAGADNTKTTVGIMAGIVAVMVVLLLLTTALKSRHNENEFSVLGKEPVEDVVEVRVHGKSVSGGNRSSSGAGAGTGGGSTGGGGSRKVADSSTKKGGDNSSRKGSQNGKSGIGDLVMVNNEKGSFGLADLMKAAAEVLGNGGLGSAYKAVMGNGVAVVVKRIKDMNKLKKEEFDEEMRKLGKVKHKNILTPLAYHYRKEEKLIVSEYVPKGSLLYVLHGDRGIYHAELNWSTRLRIIKGITRGLSYLRSEFSSELLPHGNLKSSNVFLTDTYEPLLSDYGFIGLATTDQATQAMFAFKAPEALANPQNVTPKCDVYCLGMVILEILTGKFPSQYLSAGKGGTDVVQWVQTAVQEEKEKEFLDPEIVGSDPESVDDMVQLLHIGVACIESNPEQRPSMEEAVKRIEEIQG